MRVTKIEVEGAADRAVLFRNESGALIVNIMGRPDSWPVSRSEEAGLARRLQRRLDGYLGTASDIADYATAVEMLAS